MKISACIITHNEEENLPRCLRSIQSLVDEVIVVDSGSTDQTASIASAFNARFIPHKWEGYVKQKNFAISQASHPWILSIDADEEISPALLENLLKLKQRTAHPSGYEISRIVEYLGVKIFHGDWFPDRLVRLFQKEKAHFAGGEVHERLEIDGPIEKIEGYLWHYTYRDREDRLHRIYKYASLWAKSAIQRGKTATPLSPLLHAGWRLFRGFILKRGFLNGALGWEIAWGNATEVFWKYELLRKK
ncbi:MAG: glycosyltransferase family 2 protein [Verrucomicrobiota bacterium]